MIEDATRDGLLDERRPSSLARAWRSSLNAAAREPTMTLGIALLAALVAISAVAPFVVPNEPTKINMDARLEAPSSSYWFGTDAFGRDVFSRTMSGGRVSLIVAAAVSILTMIFGAAFGALAGYFRKVDAVLMRVMDGLNGDSHRASRHRVDGDIGRQLAERHNRHSGSGYAAHDARGAGVGA